jgi:hypothetical protein
MPDKTFLGFSAAMAQDPAFVNIRRTLFAVAPAAFEDITALAHGLQGGKTGNFFHGPVPGGDNALVIQGKQPFGHGIDDLI